MYPFQFATVTSFDLKKTLHNFQAYGLLNYYGSTNLYLPGTIIESSTRDRIFLQTLQTQNHRLTAWCKGTLSFSTFANETPWLSYPADPVQRANMANICKYPIRPFFTSISIGAGCFPSTSNRNEKWHIF